MDHRDTSKKSDKVESVPLNLIKDHRNDDSGHHQGSDKQTVGNVTNNGHEYSYTILDLFVTVTSIVTYIVDVGTDIWLTIRYYKEGDTWWFTLTLSFICAPYLAVWIYLLFKLCQAKCSCSPRFTKWLAVAAIPGGPVIIYIYDAIIGLRAKTTKDERKRKQLMELMTTEIYNSAELRLTEAFLEAAPELVLQLYIMLNRVPGHTDPLTEAVQWISAIASLCSLSWGLAAYDRACRLKEQRARVSYGGLTLQFLWRTFIISSRVVSFALFSTCIPFGVFALGAAHWVVMAIWITFQKARSTRCMDCKSVLFTILEACVHIFTFLKIAEGRTRLKYTFYYILTYMENLGMILAWHFMTDKPNLWYRYPAFALVLGGFFIGLIFQVIYYLKLHPNNYANDPWHPPIKVCVPCSGISCMRSRNVVLEAL